MEKMSNYIRRTLHNTANKLISTRAAYETSLSLNNQFNERALGCPHMTDVRFVDAVDGKKGVRQTSGISERNE